MADRRACDARREDRGREVLEGAEDGFAPADEQRPAADRVDVVGPAGAEQVADRHARARRSLGCQLLGRAPARREDRSAGGNRRRSVRLYRGRDRARGAVAELAAREVEQRRGQRLRRARVGDERVETVVREVDGRGRQVDATFEELSALKRVSHAVGLVLRQPGDVVEGARVAGRTDRVRRGGRRTAVDAVGHRRRIECPTLPLIGVDRAYAAAVGERNRAVPDEVAPNNDAAGCHLSRRQGHCGDVDVALPAFRRRSVLYRAPVIRPTACSDGLCLGFALRHVLAVFALRSATNTVAVSF